MRGCRRLSNSAPELDGFHDLMTDAEQGLFDLAFDRELRRERRGFITPPQARAFLQMSRAPQSDRDRTLSGNPIAAAYFRAIDSDHSPELPPAEGSSSDVASVVEVLDVLNEAGVLPQRPYGLLAGAVEEASRLALLRTHLDFARRHDHVAYLQRSQELAFLANVIVAGSSIQARAFTIQEGFDGAAAVCNLGLEHQPAPPPEDFLVGQDLVSVFQDGWKVLHDDVCLFAAKQLIEVLSSQRCDDREIQTGLDDL